MFESWEDCAIRESLEETGLNIHNVQFGHVTNDMMEDQGKHYVTIFMMAECLCLPQSSSSTREDDLPMPQNLEPHKCHGWNSYGWEELRSFVVKSKGINDSNEDAVNGHCDDVTPILFGPLLKLVEESPQKVLDFLKHCPI